MSAKRSKKKHPGVESWMWQLFHKGPFYKDNKTYREARCRAEVRLAQDKLKTEQEEKIRHGVLPSEKALADAELHTLALNAVIPFCGNISKTTLLSLASFVFQRHLLVSLSFDGDILSLKDIFEHLLSCTIPSFIFTSTSSVHLLEYI
ncbi:hypothetical protein B0H10DRAFT_1066192 [Mycena sp. CBHHK59/15]|nr:hypothetical protein B0H10DRAFT_1066192 [Mycena sp. CBHHK59/15]